MYPYVVIVSGNKHYEDIYNKKKEDDDNRCQYLDERFISINL